jgi:uncharacterized RDD family membrane protein YckC
MDRGETVDRSETIFAGLATRTLAFALDAAVINGLAWFVGTVIALGLSLLGVPGELKTWLAAIGAALALVWTIAYFAFFWSASGQTLGNRVMEIRVQDAATGGPVRARRALLRVAALPLSALPLCAGFLLILVDARRRALHDRLAGTTVVYQPRHRERA